MTLVDGNTLVKSVRSAGPVHRQAYIPRGSEYFAGIPLKVPIQAREHRFEPEQFLSFDTCAALTDAVPHTEAEVNSAKKVQFRQSTSQ